MCGSNGRSVVERQDAELSKTGKARRDVEIAYLRQQPLTRWTRPHASSLGDHLYVIRFRDENRKQHRMFGFADIPHHLFVICLTGYEKDNVYHPHDYIDRVKRCRDDIGPRIDERTRLWR